MSHSHLLGLVVTTPNAQPWYSLYFLHRLYFFLALAYFQLITQATELLLLDSALTQYFLIDQLELYYNYNPSWIYSQLDASAV
jgi:hypothetical protein